MRNLFLAAFAAGAAATAPAADANGRVAGDRGATLMQQTESVGGG